MPKRRRGSGPGIGRRKRWIQRRQDRRPWVHNTVVTPQVTPQKVDPMPGTATPRTATPRTATHGEAYKTYCQQQIAKYDGYILELEQMSFTAEVDHIRHIKKQYVQKYFIELKRYWTNTLKGYKVKQIHTIANEVAADKVIGGLPPKGKLAN